MDAQTWLSGFQTTLAELTGAAGVAVSDEERDALLDLARVAAHESERWAAPITTYLAGLALAGADPADRGARLRAVVDAVG